MESASPGNQCVTMKTTFKRLFCWLIVTESAKTALTATFSISGYRGNHDYYLPPPHLVVRLDALMWRLIGWFHRAAAFNPLVLRCRSRTTGLLKRVLKEIHNPCLPFTHANPNRP